MKHLIRNLTVLGVVAGAAASASAVTLDFHFKGTYVAGGGATSVTSYANPSLGITNDNSSQAIAGIDYSYSTLAPSFVGGTGSVTFADTSKVYFAFDGDQDTSTVDGIVVSFYSDAAHLHSLSGGGSVSNNFDTVTGAPVEGQFYGEYQAVPEPASMGAMALGVVGLIARRKRGAR